MFKKLLMAASLVATLFANSALAGTWTATVTATSYAAELFGDGTVVLNPGTAVYAMNAAPPLGNSFNVDYTMTGASWGAALSSASLSLLNDPTTQSGAASITLVDGGGIADSTAKFRVDATTAFGAINQLQLFFNFDGATGLGTPGGTVTLAVSLTDTLGALDTAGAAQTIATSAEGTGFTAVPNSGATLKAIDVLTGSTTFVDTTAAGTLTNSLGTFTIADASAAGAFIFEDDSVNGNQAILGAAATQWSIGTGDSQSATGVGTVTVTGDFSASVGVDADETATTS